MKDKMLAFLKERKYCVISTVGSDGKPEAAFVAFSNDGLDLYIGTSNKSRKFQNLLSNTSVAIVVADESGSVQYEGQAQIVDSDNVSAVEEQHFGKVPGSSKYRNDPSQQYIKITPTWIRFIEHGDVDQMEEWNDF